MRKAVVRVKQPICPPCGDGCMGEERIRAEHHRIHCICHGPGTMMVMVMMVIVAKAFPIWQTLF